jgi:hypothetical protein
VERVYRLADGPEADEALDILERYRVGYVFFGSLERQKYGRQAEERLARWLTPVFQADGAVVFAAPSATAEVLSGGASGSPFGKLRAGSGRTPTVGVRRSQSEERQP